MEFLELDISMDWAIFAAIKKSIHSAKKTTAYALPTSLINARAMSLLIAPKKPPSANAIACEAPQSPILVPSVFDLPSLASCIIVAIAAIENEPLATPRIKTFNSSNNTYYTDYFWHVKDSIIKPIQGFYKSTQIRDSWNKVCLLNNIIDGPTFKDYLETK